MRSEESTGRLELHRYCRPHHIGLIVAFKWPESTVKIDWHCGQMIYQKLVKMYVKYPCYLLYEVKKDSQDISTGI
jgi:hypothetical protein